MILRVVINILLASLASFAMWQRDDLSSRTNELSESYGNLEQQLNLTRTQLNNYKVLAECYSSLIASGNATTGIIGHTTVSIAAVRAIRRGFRIEYEGVVMTADVELREGSGRSLRNILNLTFPLSRRLILPHILKSRFRFSSLLLTFVKAESRQ